MALKFFLQSFYFQDKYLLASIFLLCVVCVWHASVAIMDMEQETGNLVDGLVFGTTIFIYILFNVTFAIMIYNVVCAFTY